MFFVPIPRKIAKERGLKHYQSASLCPFNNIAPRLVSSKGCVCLECKAKRSIKKKQWVEENKDHVKSYQKEYIKSIPLEIRRAKQRVYRSLNTEQTRTSQRIWRIKNKSKLKVYGQVYRKKYAVTLRLKYLKNRLSHIAYASEYRLLHKESTLLSSSRWRRNNPEKVSEYSKNWRQNNPEKSYTYSNARRSQVKNSILTIWNELDEFVLQQTYELCKLREKCLNIKFQTDHMIPLRSKTVSGLHVWNNFQCLPQVINMFKQNKLIYTNPHEWLYDIPKFFKVVYQKEIAA